MVPQRSISRPCYNSVHIRGEWADSGSLWWFHWPPALGIDWQVSTGVQGRWLTGGIAQQMQSNSPHRFTVSEQRSQPGKRDVQCPVLCSKQMPAAWAGAVLSSASTLALTGRDCSRTETLFTLFSIWFPFSDHFFFPHLLPTSLISFLFHLMLSDPYQWLSVIIQIFRHNLDIWTVSSLLRLLGLLEIFAFLVKSLNIL